MSDIEIELVKEDMYPVYWANPVTEHSRPPNVSRPRVNVPEELMERHDTARDKFFAVQAVIEELWDQAIAR